MGAGSSTPKVTKAQQDLHDLGQRFAFGDAELKHLYQAYHEIAAAAAASNKSTATASVANEQKSHNSSDNGNGNSHCRSFLSEWAVQCCCAVPAATVGQRQQHNPVSMSMNNVYGSGAQAGSAGAAQQQQAKRSERELLLQVVETQILPPQWGNRLYRVAFVGPDDEKNDDYASNCNCILAAANAPNSSREDDSTRKQRLYAFFEGLSNASRRGSKQALTVLFQSCLLPPAADESQTTTTKAASVKKVAALDFVAIGYRLALATAFLQAAENDLETDMSDYLPLQSPESISFAAAQDDDDNENSRNIHKKRYEEHNQQLQALANSILERAKSRRERQGIFTTTTAVPLQQKGSSSSEAEKQTVENGWVELDDILDWGDTVAPLFASILPTFLYQIFFPGRPYPPSRTAFVYPIIPMVETTTSNPPSSSGFFTSESCPLLFTFACLSSALNGPYYRLYTSDSDGLSFNRLQNALLGYSGPTLILIRNQHDASLRSGIFGAFTASPWKESKDFYGNSDCFLFQVSPTCAVYRPTCSNNNFQYCNSFSRSKGYDQQAHGIGFGGTTQQPRLFLAENFDDNLASSADLTFENGKLLSAILENSEASSSSTAAAADSRKSTSHFHLESLEVWGVGGDEVVSQALSSRDKARAIKDEGIRRARKVDKAQFLDDFRSGVISSKAFAYREQIDGRADQDVKERHNQQQ